jgi:transposase-like protein
MTYSVDIINLCIRHYYNGEKINNISKIIDVSVANIYNWIHKYFNNFNDGIYITDNEFKIIKDIRLK